VVRYSVERKNVFEKNYFLHVSDSFKKVKHDPIKRHKYVIPTSGSPIESPRINQNSAIRLKSSAIGVLAMAKTMANTGGHVGKNTHTKPHHGGYNKRSDTLDIRV
jgi:hypothetical protein